MSKIFLEPFSWRRPLALKKACPQCGQDFEPELGFYYGAMFLSYAISSIILLPLILTLVFALKMKFIFAVIITIAVEIVLYFKIVRLARSLWIHIVVGYEGLPKT